MPGQVYRFDAFTLNEQEQLLTKDGHALSVPPKVFETLLTLVENEGRLVRRSALVARLWPDSVVEDGTLARYISDLRKILGEPSDGSKFIETVPRAGYRFAVPVTKVIEAEDAETERRTEAPVNASHPVVPPSGSGIPHGRRLLAAVLLLCLAVACGAAFLWKARHRAAVETIAVLPLIGLDNSPDNAVLGQELADSIITRLSSSDLIVRPTSAVLRYGSAPRDPVIAGRTLRVDAVLDGSMYRRGSVERVTVRLVRCSDGRSLWSASFEQPVDSLFDLEDVVSDRLTSALLLHTPKPALGASHADEGNEAARLAYYQGRFWLEKRNKQGLLNAVKYFQGSINADAAYARPYSGLAQAYLLLIGYAFYPRDQYLPLARAAAQRAATLNPSLPEAHTSLGLIAESNDDDWSRTELEYRTAINLAPQDAVPHHLYGEYLAYMGRFPQSRNELKRAQELDPTSLIIAADISETAMLSRDYGRAVRLSKQILQLDPDFVRARLWLAVALVLQGRCAEAQTDIAAAQRLETSARWIETRGIVEATCGQPLQAISDIALLARETDSDWSQAVIYTALGKNEEAFASLSRAVERHDIGVINLKVHPLFDRLRGDPRFPALLARMHFPAS